MELTPLQLLTIVCLAGLITFLFLSLGFVLGYSCNRLYNHSAKLAMNNLGLVNDHLSQQLQFKESQGSNTTHITPRSINGEPMLRRRSDEYEAALEDGSPDIDSMIRGMSPQEQANFLANEGIAG